MDSAASANSGDATAPAGDAAAPAGTVSREPSMLIASSQVKIRFFISLSPLIRPQGFHRLEFRCFCRRVAAEQHA